MLIKDAAMVVSKAVGAETTVINKSGICYGAIVTSASGVAADALLTIVQNDVDFDIPIDVPSGSNTQVISFPYPVKFATLKATLVGAGTSMHIFYG